MADNNKPLFGSVSVFSIYLQFCFRVLNHQVVPLALVKDQVAYSAVVVLLVALVYSVQQEQVVLAYLEALQQQIPISLNQQQAVVDSVQEQVLVVDYSAVEQQQEVQDYSVALLKNHLVKQQPHPLQVQVVEQVAQDYLAPSLLRHLLQLEHQLRLLVVVSLVLELLQQQEQQVLM